MTWREKFNNMAMIDILYMLSDGTLRTYGVYKSPDNYCDLYLFDDTQTAEKEEILKAVGKVTGYENGLWW